MVHVNMCVRAVGAGMGVLMCAGAFGQSIGPTLGTVELRWRERSTAGYNGSYTIGPWVAPGVDAMPTPDPSAASVTAQDASVVLVLEARVTQAPGLTGNPIRGLRGAYFNIATNQTSGGAFARQTVPDQVAGVNPRANARITSTTLGFNPSTLLEFPSSGAVRSLVSPFRESALSTGTLSGPGMGHFRDGDFNTIHNLFPSLQTSNLDPANIDATNPGQYALAGLGEWVPIYLTVYTITDVSTPRDIVFSPFNSIPPDGFGQVTDYGFRTWRGAGNSANGQLDLWRVNPAFTTPPTFTVHVVPGPGVAGIVGIAGLLTMGRRKRAV